MDIKKEERQNNPAATESGFLLQRVESERRRFIALMSQIGGMLKTCSSLDMLDTAEFLARGYSQAEVSAALSWLIDKITLETGNLTLPYSNFPAVRIFNDAENARIAMPAQEYLTQLRRLRIVSQNDFERIVDSIMRVGEDSSFVADLPKTQLMAGAVIFANADANNPGSRLMLNMNDSIQ